MSAISKQAFAQKPNGWNRLDTLFSKGKAGGTPTSTNKEYYNGEIPFLSISDITKQGKYVRYTENHLSRSGLENSSAWVVPEYSLIISMYASVGLVTINEVPITTSQAMFAMQLRDKDLLDYLYYYLSYFKYRHIHKYLETGTQSNINADIVRGIMIPTYGHSRNMKIASTLQGIDAKIDNELSVLKLFNRQKNLSFVPDVYMNIWVRRYCFCMVNKVSLRSSLMMHSSYECSIFATQRMLLPFEEYGNT